MPIIISYTQQCTVFLHVHPNNSKATLVLTSDPQASSPAVHAGAPVYPCRSNDLKDLKDTCAACAAAVGCGRGKCCSGNKPSVAGAPRCTLLVRCTHVGITKADSDRSETRTPATMSDYKQTTGCKAPPPLPIPIGLL